MIRFEKDRARKLADHRRAVLRVESQIGEHSRKLQEIDHRRLQETQKLRAALAELSTLQKVRYFLIYIYTRARGMCFTPARSEYGLNLWFIQDC